MQQFTDPLTPTGGSYMWQFTNPLTPTNYRCFQKSIRLQGTYFLPPSSGTQVYSCL